MSDVRNARRGVIGGFGAGSGAAIPALALSRCWAFADCEQNGATQRRVAARTVAGECGNRTHPTLRSRVTVILKITEATRPHPPPCVSMDFDRNFSPFGDFADDSRSRDA